MGFSPDLSNQKINATKTKNQKKIRCSNLAAFPKFIQHYLLLIHFFFRQTDSVYTTPGTCTELLSRTNVINSRSAWAGSSQGNAKWRMVTRERRNAEDFWHLTQRALSSFPCIFYTWKMHKYILHGIRDRFFHSITQQENGTLNISFPLRKHAFWERCFVFEEHLRSTPYNYALFYASLKPNKLKPFPHPRRIDLEIPPRWKSLKPNFIIQRPRTTNPKIICYNACIAILR